LHISNVTIDLCTDDLNSLIQDLAPDLKIRLTDIDDNGLHGHVKLLFWNIDFVARPAFTTSGEVALDVTAHKLVPIPGSLVQHQLKEAIKDAPAGIEVIQQSLRVHLPSLLAPLGMSLKVREITMMNGMLRIAVADAVLPLSMMARPGKV